MIPVSAYQNPVPGSREANALKKAEREKPSVVLDAQGPGIQYYLVKSKYIVRIDGTGGQPYIGCNCPAGAPPAEWEREPSACFHAASVLLFIAEKEKEADGADSERNFDA